MGRTISPIEPIGVSIDPSGNIITEKLLHFFIISRNHVESPATVRIFGGEEEVISKHVFVFEFNNWSSKVVFASLMPPAREGITGRASKFFFVPDVDKSLKAVLRNELEVNLSSIVS